MAETISLILCWKSNVLIEIPRRVLQPRRWVPIELMSPWIEKYEYCLIFLIDSCLFFYFYRLYGWCLISISSKWNHWKLEGRIEYACGLTITWGRVHFLLGQKFIPFLKTIILAKTRNKKVYANKLDSSKSTRGDFRVMLRSIVNSANANWSTNLQLQMNFFQVLL